MEHRLLTFEIKRCFGEGMLPNLYLDSFLELIEQAYEHADQEKLRLYDDLERTFKELDPADTRVQCESTKFIRLIFDTLKDGLYVTDHEGRVLLMNQAAEQIFGHEERELKDQLIHSIVHHCHPDGSPYPSDECPLARVFSGGVSYSGQETFITKDGRHVPVGYIANPILQDGRVSGSMVFFRDLSEQAWVEAMLRASEHRYRSVVDNVREVIFQTDRGGRWTFLNLAWQELLGHAVPASLGTSFLRYVHPDDCAEIAHCFETVVGGRKADCRHEVRYLKQDGGISWMEVFWRVTRGGDGAVQGVSGTLNDITERKLAESQLKLHRAALDAAANMVLIADREGTIQYVNRAFAAGTGYPAEEAIGKSTRLLKSGLMDRQFYADLWQIVLSGKVWEGELVNRRQDGTLYPEEQTITPLMDEHGEITHFIAIKRDISERKMTELELENTRDQALQGSRLKSEFLSTVSHEIRTPMNGVLGMADLLMETALSSEQRGLLGTLRESAVSLLTIINDILDFSKVEAGKMLLESLAFSPAAAVEGVTSLLMPKALSKDIPLKSFVSPAVPAKLLGDPGRLRQVIMNLTANALKFTDHGEVLVAVSLGTQDAATVTLRFAVSDTGIGLSRETLDLLFQPFVQADGSTTRKYGGTGLGLSISKHLVELMGGEMGAESEEGTGSTFWFTIPFKRVEPLPEDLPLRDFRLLLAGADPFTAETVTGYLRTWGLEGICRETSEALETLRRAEADEKPFDLLLLCAERDELETWSRWMRSELDLPPKLIWLSPQGEEDGRSRAMAAGFAASLVRPIYSSPLFDCLTATTTLTRTVPVASPSAIAATPPTLPIRGGRILLVEDNPINQKVALMHLSKLGCVPEVASNGQEALMMLEHGTFNLVLMDCQMPVMDGFETTRQIRSSEAKNGGHLTLVAMTANAMAGDRQRCLEAGMDDYLSKPFTREQLYDVLSRWLGAAPEPQEGSLPPPIDRDRLADLMTSAELEELLNLFASMMPESLSKIRAACEQQDLKTFKAAVHDLKGSSANMGANRLAELCRGMELAEDWRERCELLPPFEQEAGRVRLSIC